MDDEQLKDLDSPIFPSLEGLLYEEDPFLGLDVEEILKSNDNQEPIFPVNQPLPLQLENYSAVSFTNQLGQCQEIQTNLHPLTANSSLIVIPCEPSPPESFDEIVTETPPNFTESFDQIIAGIQIQKPPPRKRGRKPNPFKPIKEKKAKLYHEYNFLEPEKNSKKVTDAYNARVTREKQKLLQDTLTKERDEAREENLILKVQLEERDVQLEEEREKVRRLEKQLMEKSGNCGHVENTNQVQATGDDPFFVYDVEEMAGDLFQDVLFREDPHPAPPLPDKLVTL